MIPRWDAGQGQCAPAPSQPGDHQGKQLIHSTILALKPCCFSLSVQFSIDYMMYSTPCGKTGFVLHDLPNYAAAASLQSCPTLCDPIDGSPPGSPIPGILQARTLEWVAISFSSAWKWKLKVKSPGHVRLLQPHRRQPTRLIHPWGFPGKSTGVGCHCLLPCPTIRLCKCSEHI